MARGNLIDGATLEVTQKCGLTILNTHFDWDDFTKYDKFHISKKGTLIGTWGSRVGYKYRDYL